MKKMDSMILLVMLVLCMNLTLLSDALGCGNGPCMSLFSPNCGDANPPAGTCDWGGEPGYPVCEGDCAQWCPQGPKYEYCYGLVGSCTETFPPCSFAKTAICGYDAMYVGCRCTYESTLIPCGIRSDC